MKYEGRIFSVYNEDIKTPDGLNINRDLVDHKNAVSILAKYKDKYVLTHEYRTGVNAITYGLPAGLIKENESIQNAALRELKEETGLFGKSAKHLYTINSSEGFTNENNSLVFINVDFDSHKTCFDKDELVNYELISKDDLYDIAMNTEKVSYPLLISALHLK